MVRGLKRGANGEGAGRYFRHEAIRQEDERGEARGGSSSKKNVTHTWADIYELGLGAGLKPSELEQMTFNELYYYLQGHDDRRLDGMREARIVAWSVFKAMAGKKAPRKPTDLFEIPGDRPRKTPRSGLTKEEHRALVKRLSGSYKKWKKGQDERGIKG